MNIEWTLVNEGTDREEYMAEYRGYMLEAYLDDDTWCWRILGPAGVGDTDGDIADSLEDAQRSAIAALPRDVQLAAEYIGREWPCELQGNWRGLYPVVSNGRIIDIYNAEWAQPSEYAGKPIIDDEYIDADAPNEIEDGLYSTEEAARILGVSERRVRALCAEGRMGRRVGDTWVISAQDIRLNQERRPGRPRTFVLRDYQTGQDIICPIRRSQEAGEAVLLHVQVPDVGLVAAVAYSDGSYCTPRDWQGEQPQTVADIPRWQWVDQDGQPAVVVDGLPRVIR